MDQHEQDWLDLGRKLKDYQPKGQPGEDFQDFQKLQSKNEPRRVAWWFTWYFLPAFLLVFSMAYYWQQNLPKGADAEIQLTSELISADEKPEEPKVITAETKTKTAGLMPGRAASTVEAGLENMERSSPVLTLPQNHADNERKISSVTAEPGLTNSTPTPTTNQPIPGQNSPVLLVPDQGAEAIDLAAEPPPPEQVMVTEMLAVRPVDELPIGHKELALDIRKNKSRPRLSLGAGISNHWRGEKFLQDVDRGLYVNLGVYQPIGRRFGLEAQLGYRSHDLNVPILSDAKEPWSYHKDEIHNTGQMGEIRVYTYEGIVESYRAVELSLLVHYQLEPRIGIHAGARYALPAIKFRRLVHGPDNENPFSDFIEQQEIVKSRDYGGILGLNYRLTNHLSLQGEVHLGLVDLIENAAQDGEQFNRSNSLSVGLRYRFK